ncbi:hypothetical protein BJ170DRAFT_156736 [Xylariales sp. AK1849]|nr:hypothetical protein BJ170DRAFT_156736 [Xylariales sp. AK1849]
MAVASSGSPSPHGRSPCRPTYRVAAALPVVGASLGAPRSPCKSIFPSKSATLGSSSATVSSTSSTSTATESSSATSTPPSASSTSTSSTFSVSGGGTLSSATGSLTVTSSTSSPDSFSTITSSSTVLISSSSTVISITSSISSSSTDYPVPTPGVEQPTHTYTGSITPFASGTPVLLQNPSFENTGSGGQR